MAVIGSVHFVRVLLEPVRSADPPIISGMALVSTSSASPDAFRVAHVGGSSASRRLCASRAACHPAGRVPAIMRRNSALGAGSIASTRASQAARAAAPRSPTSRQADSTASGTTKGAWGQPSFSRAPAISSKPRGAPWVAAVPALPGAPYPMVVRQPMRDGLAEARAVSMAAATASQS